MNDLITEQSGPVLLYLDYEQELRLQMHPFKSSLAPVMLHTSKLVAFISKSLNSTEDNSADGEGAVCNIVWLQMFSQVLLSLQSYRCKVIVKSDHEPLETTPKRPLAATPPRGQRIILNLQRYIIKIMTHPGKYIAVADTPSEKSIKHHDR